MIGIFDSGIGGMTVARAVEKAMPGRQLVYFGDLARTPYGSKSADVILNYSRQNIQFLLAQGAKIIIIACNSAASTAFDILQKEFAVPIFEVIMPAVHKAAAVTQTGRIGVIGTRATIKSRIYEKRIMDIAPHCRVFAKACPLLVPLVEEGWLKRRETKMIVRRYLHPIKLKNVDTFVLGCTHYPLLTNLIQPRIGKRVQIIDSSKEVADTLKKFIDSDWQTASEVSCGKENIYYVSDITEAASSTARMIFERDIKLIKV